MSRSKPLSVYVIGSDVGPQKIGVSDNLDRRVIHLQSGMAPRLRLIASHERPLGDARLVERAAHALLAGKRASGEWFNVGIDEAIAAVERAITMVEAGEIEAPKSRPVQDGVLGIRLEPEERAALERAAKSEVASMSALGRKAIVEWLRKGGWLKPPHRPKSGSKS